MNITKYSAVYYAVQGVLLQLSCLKFLSFTIPEKMIEQ